MALSKQILLSHLLNHNTRCDKGLDHGQGVLAWMHPPVHRILGWATRPSALSLSRDVWRLNQIKAITNNQIYLKGEPALSDQATLDRFPTLINADLLNTQNEKIGLVADFLFETNTGKILYYLVSRSSPKIPGTSRWRLSIDHIIDKQPGLVITDIMTLEEIPIVKSSIKQDLFKSSKKWKEEFQKISLKVNNRLEGWLEETDWDDNVNYFQKNNQFLDSEDQINYFDTIDYSNNNLESKPDGDPWI